MIRLTRAQVREIDRRATEDFHIPGVVLMENASRGAVDIICANADSLRLRSPNPSALILCGGGNNGGDGLAIARHLHNRWWDVAIGLTLDPRKYQGDALINWRIAEGMKLKVFAATPRFITSTDAGVIIDAIFGTGLTEPPRAPFAEIVAAIAQSGKPVVSIDLPSGLDCDTGLPLGACVRANLTVTFVAEKIGFANPAAREFTGSVHVADIGCPRELIPNE
jgi:NAD(P)H-hydrate epimerase